MGTAQLFTPSARVADLPVSATLRINEEVARRRAAGEVVWHMGFGESPFPVHPRIKDALAAAAALNGYPPTLGLADLRRAALRYFSPRLGFRPDEMDCIVGPGSKDLIFALQMAIDGDLLLPVPSWVSYAPQARLVGTGAARIATTSANHHRVTGRLVGEAVAKARAAGLNPRKIILNYPNNPSGLGFSNADLDDIATACRREGLIVISDEIYALTNHGGPHNSIANHYPEGTVITTGLSKHLSLGGWRVGFAFVPRALGGLLEGLSAVASETWSGVSHPVQKAALAGLEGHADIEAHIALCTRAHGLACNYVRDALNALGLDYPPLAGGFYMYPDFTRFAAALLRAYGVATSNDLAIDLMRRLSLATLPGTSFGEAPEVLSLRIAATDYDGAAALDWLADRTGDITSVEFVSTCAPRVQEACNKLISYVSNAA